MEEKLISFEEVNSQVEAHVGATRGLDIDLCSVYKKVRSVLLFAKQILPKNWRQLVEDFMNILDEQCHISQ